MKEFEVFHPVYGLVVKGNAPVVVGEFRFLNIENHEMNVASEYGIHITGRSLLSFGNDCESCVSVRVLARDIDHAKDRAKDCFMHLQNLFRFTLNSLLDYDFDVGIYNYKQPSRDYNLVLSKDGDGRDGFHAYGGYRKIDIEQLLAMNNQSFRVLANIITSKVRNPLETRKLIALDLIGESQHIFGSAMSVFQLVAAIDALLGKNMPGEQKSIFSNYVAQLLETHYTKQMLVKSEASELYDIRSQIAHGERAAVGLDICKKASTVAYRVLNEIVSHPQITNMKTYNELETYLQERKASSD